MTIRRHSQARPAALPLEELREAVGSVGAIPHQLVIDLGVAQNDREYNIAGDVLLIWYAPTITDQITIKINDQSNPAIPFVIGHKMRTPFTKLYVTVPGTGAGNMYILYGMGGTQGLLDMEVTAQDIPGAMAGILTALQAIQEEVQGPVTDIGYGRQAAGLAQAQVVAANADRHGLIVTNDPTNANAVYLGFDNTVTAANFFASFAAASFDRVQFFDYRGPVHVIAGGAGNNVGYGEW